MNRTLRLTVKVLFGTAVVGALGLGASQAVAAPAPESEPYYCYMQCPEDCSGMNWQCIRGDCICW